jgi:pilus assembly protein Flp/PilA
MQNLMHGVRQFLASEDGPTAVEYAVMVALIVVVALTAIQTLGTRTSATFKKVGDQLPTA